MKKQTNPNFLSFIEWSIRSHGNSRPTFCLNSQELELSSSSFLFLQAYLVQTGWVLCGFSPGPQPCLMRDLLLPFSYCTGCCLLCAHCAIWGCRIGENSSFLSANPSGGRRSIWSPWRTFKNLTVEVSWVFLCVPSPMFLLRSCFPSFALGTGKEERGITLSREHSYCCL